VSSQRKRARGKKGPQCDSPSHSHSNSQICKDTIPIGIPLVPLTSGSTSSLGGSTHVCTSGIPAGIPSCADTLYIVGAQQDQVIQALAQERLRRVSDRERAARWH
jgi:hypothetical protein